MSPKTVLVTGCTDGSAGANLARTFAARGLKVIAASRSVSKMSALAAVPNVVLLELDRKAGLINNAAVAYRCAALEPDDQMARALFDVNFWGVVDMCRAFAPLVIEAKAFYGASKAALSLYTNNLRLELLPFGVNVLDVVPGGVRTNMNSENARAPATLPADGSIFKPAEKRIMKSIVHELMPADKFANKVVTDILSGATGQTWRGAFATRIWLMVTFLPQAALDKVLTMDTGVDLLGRK